MLDPRIEASLENAKNLDDDTVKLVGYNIVSIRPGCERWVIGGFVVVADCMSAEEFIAWIIRCYCNLEMPKLSVPPDLHVQMALCLQRSSQAGVNWQGLCSGGVQGPALIYPGEKKYLRVNYNVIQRWDKPCADYCEDQVAALASISNSLARDKT